MSYDRLIEQTFPEYCPDDVQALAIPHKMMFMEKDDLIALASAFPKFDSFSKGEVKIPQTGKHGDDFKLSDDLYRKQIGDPNWKRPEHMTWHHKEDGTTMQLVPGKINGNAGHTGGAALFSNRSTGMEF